MSDARLTNRRSFILRFLRAPAQDAPQTAWCGMIETAPLDHDDSPVTRGFRDLTELPELLVEIVHHTKGSTRQ
ncbi:hypothetical protein [Tropicibacter naphthalenivorans]|uniref:Uncharacterized protein n=1 Tax=Tropicibacter naphthalenivorans TaxID=441103 RepID=A0A0P1GYS7_9RHOB|nr:hypothetical protein [Tropicibacter naphthalenivorans]CUH82541.1 hypothetical protein TRN7648_04083 [Tropicibacter naphthalenivorans]SMD09880.1 hypothetical protein SAMN04488093_12019 [Tropicibacter naphthalenivorans]